MSMYLIVSSLSQSSSSSNILLVLRCITDIKHVFHAGFWAHVVPSSVFFFLHSRSEKDNGRGGKNYVLMCNKLLDDAFHCQSNVCVRWCFVRSSTRIHCNAHIVIVIHPSLARSHTFPKRVDFKFIFICLDLSLELFFIPLTISSVSKWWKQMLEFIIRYVHTVGERERAKAREGKSVVCPQLRKSITCSTVV